MSSVLSIEAQIKCIPHLEVELNSSLDSYMLMHQFFNQMLINLNQQIISRQDQYYNFQTIHGRQVRKLMLQHYRKTFQIIQHEAKNIQLVKNKISVKHTEICSNITYIEPIIKEIKHKNMILVNQYGEIEKSIKKLQKQNNQRKKDNFLRQIQQKYKMNFNNVKNSYCSNASSNSSKSLSASYLGELKELLSLKQKQINSYMSIQSKISNEMLKNMTQMLEHSMGQGLVELKQELEEIIFNIQMSVEKNQNKLRDFFEFGNEENQMMILNKIKKRLYQNFDDQEQLNISNKIDLNNSVQKRDQQNLSKINQQMSNNSLFQSTYRSDISLNYQVSSSKDHGSHKQQQWKEKFKEK